MSKIFIKDDFKRKQANLKMAIAQYDIAKLKGRSERDIAKLFAKVNRLHLELQKYVHESTLQEKACVDDEPFSLTPT